MRRQANQALVSAVWRRSSASPSSWTSRYAERNKAGERPTTNASNSDSSAMCDHHLAPGTCGTSATCLPPRRVGALKTLPVLRVLRRQVPGPARRPGPDTSTSTVHRDAPQLRTVGALRLSVFMAEHPVIEGLRAAHAALDATSVRDAQGRRRGWVSMDG